MLKHKRLLRILALVLCVTTLFTSIHLEMLAKESTEVTESEAESSNESIGELISDTEGTDVAGEEGSQDGSQEAHILGEVESERTANSKTFYLSDGSYAVATYNEIIHYEMEDGTFVQVDNRDTEDEGSTLEETGQKEYKKRSGSKEISFREKGEKNQNLIKMVAQFYAC